MNEYADVIQKEQSLSIQKIDDNYYYFLPVGTSVFITPFVYSIDFLARHVLYFDIYPLLEKNFGGGIELFIASLIAAFTSVFIFLIVFTETSNNYLSLLLVFVFAFCTPVWSTASRALWSHTVSIFLLSIVLYSIQKARTKESWIFVTALCIAFAYVVRPTNSLGVLFISLYVLVTHTKKFFYYCIGLAFVFVPFICYNFHIYHQVLSPYYLPSTLKVGRSPYFLEALAGVLFSPGRGLFIFSPVFLFSLVGVFVKLVRKNFSLLDGIILLIMMAHYYVVASITTPYGCWSFGPRYFTDIVPFLIYFLVWFVMFLLELNPGLLKTIMTCLFVVSIVCSFYIHYKGANHPACFFDWNAVGNVEEHHDRVWQWSDLQFLR